MDYLTNYYKNLSEQLQNKVDRLSSELKLLNETDTPSEWPVQVDGYAPFYKNNPTRIDPPNPDNLPKWPYFPTYPLYDFPVWFKDGPPPKGWDGWWPDAPDGDPRKKKPDSWPRKPVWV
jgi:hypothetical protein